MPAAVLTATATVGKLGVPHRRAAVVEARCQGLL